MQARVRISLIPLLLLGAAVHGQEPDGTSPGYTTDSVAYLQSGGEELVYEIFRPEEQNGAAIAMIMSGGCLSTRPAPAIAAAQAAQVGSFAAEGFTVFHVYHGNTGACVDALADLRMAVRHIRFNAADYGVDPDRIGVSGFSSGGMLALLLGFTSDDVATVVAGAASGDHAALVDHRRRNLPERLEGFTQKDLDSSSELSANLYIDPSDPPTLLIHGDVDERVPLDHARQTHDILSDNGIETELLVIEDLGHDGRIMAAKPNALLDWYRDHLLD